MKGKDRVVRDVLRGVVGVTSTTGTITPPGVISYILTKAGGIIVTKLGAGIQVK